jgi:hypothetical protein
VHRTPIHRAPIQGAVRLHPLVPRHTRHPACGARGAQHAGAAGLVGATPTGLALSSRSPLVTPASHSDAGLKGGRARSTAGLAHSAGWVPRGKAASGHSEAWPSPTRGTSAEGPRPAEPRFGGGLRLTVGGGGRLTSARHAATCAALQREGWCKVKVPTNSCGTTGAPVSNRVWERSSSVQECWRCGLVCLQTSPGPSPRGPLVSYFHNHLRCASIVDSNPFPAIGRPQSALADPPVTRVRGLRARPPKSIHPSRHRRSPPSGACRPRRPPIRPTSGDDISLTGA